MIKKGKAKLLRQPLQHFDLKETKILFDLVQAFQHTSFQSRKLYRCFEVYREMLSDPTCVIFMGLSGTMIPGGMRKVIRDMIEMKLIDVIVSTGANVFHDIVDSFGNRHYVGFEEGDDGFAHREPPRSMFRSGAEHRLQHLMIPKEEVYNGF